MNKPVLRIFVGTTLLYLSLLMIPDKTMALMGIALFFGFLVWMLQDVSSALVIGYLALVPISIGKFFPIDLVRGAELNLLDRPFGIAANITVTVRNLLVLMMAITLIFESMRKRQVILPKDALGWGLLVLPVFWGISALFGSVRPDISLLHTLFSVEPFILYVFVTRMTPPVDYRLLLVVVAAAVLGESSVVVWQNVIGNTIGLAIENFPGYVPIDVSTDAGFLPRLGGTFPHANTLAHYLLFSVWVVTPLLFEKGSWVRTAGMGSIVSGLLALLLTLSRSAWLSGFVGLMLFFYLTCLVWRLKLTLPLSVRRMAVLGMVMLLFVGITTGIPRVVSTVHTMEPFGSGITRILLVREAGAVIRQYPVFGVGLAMDAYVFYLRARAAHVPLVSYFPDPVQNGYIQLLMQVGFAGWVPYVLVTGIMIGTIRRMARHANPAKRMYIAGLSAGFLAVCINAQFQPLLPDVSALVLLIAALA